MDDIDFPSIALSITATVVALAVWEIWGRDAALKLKQRLQS